MSLHWAEDSDPILKGFWWSQEDGWGESLKRDAMFEPEDSQNMPEVLVLVPIH